MTVFEIDPMWADVLSLREVLSVISALFVAFALKYASSHKNAPEGMLWLIAAFALEATYHVISNFTDASTTHLKAMLTTGLSARLIGSVCMVIGSIRMLNVRINKVQLLVLIVVASAISFGFSWFAIFQKSSEELFFRSAFLVSSIAYIVCGFAIRHRYAKHKSIGSSLTGLLLLLLGLYGLSLFTPIGRDLFNMWFIAPVIQLMLVNTIMLMVTDWVYQRVEMLEKVAAENKERLSLIIQSSPFPIIISRFKDDKILLINRKAGELFSVDHEKHDQYRTVDFFVDPSERNRLLNLVRQYPVVEDFEVLVQQPGSDHSFWLLLSARVIDFDYEIALYCAFQDITDRKEKEQELFNQATRDPLTKVFNRRQFDILSAKEFSRARRYGNSLCLFMIDADHFKSVNDTYGHNIGDLVLQALADCCRETLRTSDIIARFGGEEFVVLLPEVQLEKAWHIADRLRMNISDIRVPNGKGGEVKFTVSIGLVESAPGIDEADVLIKLSDDALYQAKESGRNRVIYIPRSKYSTAVPSNEYKLPSDMMYKGAVNIPVIPQESDSDVDDSGNVIETAAMVQEQEVETIPAMDETDNNAGKPIELVVDEAHSELRRQNATTVPVHTVAPPAAPKRQPPNTPSKTAPPKAATREAGVVNGGNAVPQQPAQSVAKPAAVAPSPPAVKRINPVPPKAGTSKQQASPPPAPPRTQPPGGS